MFETQVIASNIRNVRLYRNYSQDYLAFKLKISQNSYSKVECGYTKVTLERLAKIAEVLEVKIAELIESPGIEADVRKVNDIPGIHLLLEIVCSVTGMRFAAVARVTENKWVACAVNDQLSFGIKKGGELQLETTICNEIRQHGEAVIIDDVEHDNIYCQHPTPALYGFRSYISVPIFLENGSLFGTLCAIDPKPAKLKNSEIIELFRLFTRLIAFHLNPCRSSY